MGVCAPHPRGTLGATAVRDGFRPLVPVGDDRPLLAERRDDSVLQAVEQLSALVELLCLAHDESREQLHRLEERLALVPRLEWPATPPAAAYGSITWEARHEVRASVVATTGAPGQAQRPSERRDGERRRVERRTAERRRLDRRQAEPGRASAPALTAPTVPHDVLPAFPITEHTAAPDAACAADSSAERAAPACALDMTAPIETLLVFRRVPDSRRAAELFEALRRFQGMQRCILREFDSGMLVLDVRHDSGTALAEQVRRIRGIDLRRIYGRSSGIEFQLL